FSIRKLPIPMPAGEDQGLALRRKAFMQYVNRDLPGMLSAWDSQPRQAVYPTETALLAIAYAYCGNDKAQLLAGQINTFNPREADIIRSIIAYREGRNKEASHLLSRAFTEMRKDPWTSHPFMVAAFEIASFLVAVDPAYGREIFQSVKEPFAMMCFENMRGQAAFEIAATFSPQDALSQLDSLEPNVPWNRKFLRLRADTYGRMGHYMAKRAQLDYELFIKNEERQGGKLRQGK
ncbi:MAG: hypothetical protein WC637_01290, partial [Victivallales bacterium]